MYSVSTALILKLSQQPNWKKIREHWKEETAGQNLEFRNAKDSHKFNHCEYYCNPHAVDWMMWRG